MTPQITSSLASPETAVEALGSGRPIMVVADAEAAGGAVMVVAARAAEADHINLMARHARGLVCLAITGELAERLKLPLQTARSEPGSGTPFTISIEARTGVTTGISTQDRARTVQAAVAEGATAEDLVSPGHVFPVIARDGGVLVKAGFAEAAVDLAAAAGGAPSAVFCQVMNEAGEPAVGPEAAAIAEAHGLVRVSIPQIAAWRRVAARVLKRAFERDVPTVHGAMFRMVIFRNTVDGSEHVAMVRGEPTPDRETLVRSHAIDLAADLFGYDNGRRGLIDRAMAALAANDGPGVAVFLRNPHVTWASHYAHEDAERPGAPSLSEREYGIGAQMLLDLGVRRLTLLTDSPPPPGELEAYGLQVEGVRPF
jgi:3,4-dihydroxy 2-butanone 4-phosphate synthase / GTP cyclohydrolase II